MSSSDLLEDSGDVAPAVIGEEALGMNSLLGEVGQDPFQESGGGDALLVRQSFGVGVAGVVIDGDMDIVVSQSEVPSKGV